MKPLSIFVLCVSMLALAQSPQRAETLLPDAATLLTELQQNQKNLDEIRKNYICVDNEQEFELDKKGNAKKVEHRQYEVYYIAGMPIRRLLSKEGVPLSASEKEKEDRRVSKAEREARERQQKRERGEQDKDEISIRKFLETSRFSNIRHEQFQGHEVIAMDFAPNPAFDPHGRAESLVNKLAGSIWIDEKSHQVVRLDAKLVKGQSLGFGLASVKEGSGFVAEQKKVNDEVWLPASNDISISARIVFSGLRRRFVNQFSDYRKFKSDSRIIGVEEVKQ